MYQEKMEDNNNTMSRPSSVVSSAPTILWLQVRIPSTPSMLFTNCNWNKERTKINEKEEGIGPYFLIMPRDCQFDRALGFNVIELLFTFSEPLSPEEASSNAVT